MLSHHLGPFWTGIKGKNTCDVWLLPLPPPIPAGMSSQQLLLWDVTKHGLCPFNFFLKGEINFIFA